LLISVEFIIFLLSIVATLKRSNKNVVLIVSLNAIYLQKLKNSMILFPLGIVFLFIGYNMASNTLSLLQQSFDDNSMFSKLIVTIALSSILLHAVLMVSNSLEFSSKIFQSLVGFVLYSYLKCRESLLYASNDLQEKIVFTFYKTQESSIQTSFFIISVLSLV